MYLPPVYAYLPKIRVRMVCQEAGKPMKAFGVEKNMGNSQDCGVQKWPSKWL